MEKNRLFSQGLFHAALSRPVIREHVNMQALWTPDFDTDCVQSFYETAVVMVAGGIAKEISPILFEESGNSA